MTTDQASDNQSKPRGGQEPTNVERRAAIGAGLAACRCESAASINGPSKVEQCLNNTIGVGVPVADDTADGVDGALDHVGADPPR